MSEAAVAPNVVPVGVPLRAGQTRARGACGPSAIQPFYRDPHRQARPTPVVFGAGQDCLSHPRGETSRDRQCCDGSHDRL
jgi:hypothetical protein